MLDSFVKGRENLGVSVVQDAISGRSSRRLRVGCRGMGSILVVIYLVFRPMGLRVVIRLWHVEVMFARGEWGDASRVLFHMAD
jgi:hypothetical protein